MENIFSIVSKIDFFDVENYSNLLKNIIQGTIKEHAKEKENLFLLYHIKAKGNQTLSIQDCIEILQCFNQIELFAVLNEKNAEINATPEVDKDYIIQRKDDEIRELKKQFVFVKDQSLKFLPIQKKPKFFESYIPYAVREGRLDSVQYLIEKQKVNINQKDSKYGTAFHVACEYNQPTIIQYLIEKGADIEAKNSNEQTPLHLACNDDNLPIIEYLIEKGANIEAKDYDGKTPLHYASFYGKNNVVKYLLSKEANKNAKDRFGKTPYDLACEGYGADESQRDIIKELLKHQ